jgi:hypothetical protein
MARILVAEDESGARNALEMNLLAARGGALGGRSS